MENESRRHFLTRFGVAIGAFTMGRDLMKAHAASAQVATPPGAEGVESLAKEITFEYSPPFWQSTYCFPDDPYKSLVGKSGELLYGHPGTQGELDAFAIVVSVALQGQGEGTYVEQRMEAPAIPIVTTTLEFQDAMVKLVSFATTGKEEGRVDNLIVEITPKRRQALECTPEIRIRSAATFVAAKEDDFGALRMESEKGKVFMLTNRPLALTHEEGVWRCLLKGGTASTDKPLELFVRFPQEGQEQDKVKDRLDKSKELVSDARSFWQLWNPTEGKVTWQILPPYQNFLTASARNIQESREVKNGKKLFQVGPTVYRGLWMIDGYFILEAARYMGYDKEAQEGLEAIWDRQAENGLFSGGAGEAHWKDTAAAVFTLIRQAELSQDWTFFNEMYPDAYKGMMALKDLRDQAAKGTTSNGRYGLLPQGFGDSGIGGIRAEFTNTLWTLMALKALYEVTNRIFAPRRQLIREFYGELRRDFYAATSREIKKHPLGFNYLPMLLKDDPKWQEADERKQPRPQVAQVYLAHAIYPGLLFEKDDRLTVGEIDLMKAVTKEGIPSETGWLTDQAVWTYNAAAVAQVYLWAGLYELARKTFIGFLNHASPLYAWREEQSLKGVTPVRYIGDMPHNWASAECIRYLRHMMIMEDEKNLRLFDGLGAPEYAAGEKLSLTYSPTRWGRVTASLEPLDKKTWKATFKREDFNDATNSKLVYVEMPRRLPGGFTFDKLTGGVAYKNGERVLVPAEHTAWEGVWKTL